MEGNDGISSRRNHKDLSGCDSSDGEADVKRFREKALQSGQDKSWDKKRL